MTRAMARIPRTPGACWNSMISPLMVGQRRTMSAKRDLTTQEISADGS